MHSIQQTEMELLSGGKLTVSEGVGFACGATLAIGILGGFGGLVFALIVGPTVCVGGSTYAIVKG
jgi:hypothetical protein